MIKSLEKFKKFDQICNLLKQRFTNIEQFFDNEFLNKVTLLFDNFENFSLDDLETIISYVKSYKFNVEKFECNKKIKDECLIFINDCISFINDLIMNQIIENI